MQYEFLDRYCIALSIIKLCSITIAWCYKQKRVIKQYKVNDNILAFQ